MGILIVERLGFKRQTCYVPNLMHYYYNIILFSMVSNVRVHHCTS